MRDSWRHFAAEFIGIFALVFVGGASIMSSAMSNNTNGLVVAAIAHGVILAIMVTATMRISGHLNPAVTLGFLATRRIEPMMAMVYIVERLGTSQQILIDALAAAIKVAQAHGSVRPGDAHQMGAMCLLITQSTIQSAQMVEKLLDTDALNLELGRALNGYLKS